MNVTNAVLACHSLGPVAELFCVFPAICFSYAGLLECIYCLRCDPWSTVRGVFELKSLLQRVVHGRDEVAKGARGCGVVRLRFCMLSAAFRRNGSPAFVCEFIGPFVAFVPDVRANPVEVELEVWRTNKGADVVDEVVVCLWSPLARYYVYRPLAVRMDVRGGDVVL